MEPPASPQTVIRDCVPQSPPYPFRALHPKIFPKKQLPKSLYQESLSKDILLKLIVLYYISIIYHAP